jgi:hypothetical protein
LQKRTGREAEIVYTADCYKLRLDTQKQHRTLEDGKLMVVRKLFVFRMLYKVTSCFSARCPVLRRETQGQAKARRKSFGQQEFAK